MSGLESVRYDDRGTALTGWLARPEGPPRGAVLVWPTIANATPAIERRARLLAEQGYMALIADFYGEAVRDFDHARALATALRADPDHYRARLFAGLAALQSLPDAAGLPTASFGYCMGGQAVLELARAGAEIKGCVSFHGVFETDRPAQPGAVRARVLVCHGDADPMATRQQVLKLWDEFDAAGVNWHFHSYSGVKHGFTDPASDGRGMAAIGYDPSADRQSWAAALDFLDEVLFA